MAMKLTLRDLDWKLNQIGDCTVMDKTICQAAKDAAHTLAELRNMLDVPADAEPGEILAAVYNRIKEGE